MSYSLFIQSQINNQLDYDLAECCQLQEDTGLPSEFGSPECADTLHVIEVEGYNSFYFEPAYY